ncbi:MAG: type I DNA topoisomerase [Chloroflexota bacterium]
MAKQSLVVVESAAKAKTIEKILGRGFTVRACLGHVRDLPTSKLGVDVEHEFRPQYVVPKERKDIVKRLKDEARGKGAVLLATDPDREGEAIAWHLVSALGLDTDQPVSRIEFHEITRGAVLDALQHPRSIDMDRVDAQQARRVVDRLIGYPVSGFLGKKIRRGLSAGRVQSVAVRIVVDREREIEAFVPVEYWSLQAELARRNGRNATFTANVLERQGEKVELHTGIEAALVEEDLQGANWLVAAVREREQQRHPDAPFTTSTLQQDASRKLGYSARRTMVIAQQLYEGVALEGGENTGLITYMRTDSVTVATVAQDEARDYIRTKLSTDMLPAQVRAYKTRSKLAQEAHEAIRPTSVFREPEALRSHLSPEQFRLYDLIWKRFLASQMASAIFDVTTVDVDAQATDRPKYRFRASGQRLKFAGFLSLYRAGQEEEEVEEDRQPLPELTAGDLLNLIRLIPAQHFTQPPPRYSEATLVKALEERGVGRPSTYAPILGTIQDRGYVERDGRRLKPTDLGMLVNDVLVQQFGDIMDPDFTAVLEDKLDEVAQGERSWVPVVQEFYEPLNRDLERALVEVERLKPAEIATDEVCSQGHPMVIKDGRFGRFMACTQYPEHKETRPLPEELPKDAPEEHCSHAVVMQLRTGRFGPFYTSTHECGETKPFARRVGVACPKDGGEILEKRSKKGRVFYGCAQWPNCDWVSWNKPLVEPCPECGGLQVDLGRGRVRCLKHEGEPPRFGGSKESSDGEGATARKNGASARNSGTTTRKSPSSSTSRNGASATPRKNGAATKTRTAPKAAARKTTTRRAAAATRNA